METNKVKVKRWSESVECECSCGRKLMINIGFDYTGDLLTGPYGVFMTIEDEDDMVYSNLDEDEPYVRTAERYVAVLMQLDVGERVLFELFDRAESSVVALEHLRQKPSEKRAVTQLIVPGVYTDSEKLGNGRIAVVLCESFAGECSKVAGGYQRWAKLGVVGGCYYNGDDIGYYVHPNFTRLIELGEFKKAAETNPELDARDPLRTIQCLLKTPVV